ncbi:6-phosphogluconolactonase [Falsihalocynthiibacter arcticus]|uniref:6-phosphogluconolactonase n=1 Tax=Falsihalocynthiibacter arcticus TaxID=1579316 RepID=A0A126V2J9_9RHOB|nr:6-phosphogluconolactonase [Falsihalocynthiibacter arcticus]AML52548.1 6-phosphogluconolactonase [Falsihalocynthiibacter arcticus]
MKFVEYSSREALMTGLASHIAQELTAEIAETGSAALAVPGGSTPGPIFDALSQVDLPWEKVSVLLGDERWVPETSERSNTALLRRRLLQNKAARATLLPLYAPADRPEDRLNELSQAIENVLPLSVCVMGMGADMHTVSIFPEADLLAEAFAADAPVLLPMRAPGAPEPRITLTARVLAGSKHRHILITGAEKRAALERAILINDPMKAPICAVLSGATIHWAD